MLRILLNNKPLRRYSSHVCSLIDIQPDISKALRCNGPVVALESTIITHGMPYPQNLETALAVENIVRKENAIPATIAIINGRIKVGLSAEELESLAKGARGTNAEANPTMKTSRRDLAFIISKGWNGGTTVASTLIVSDLVGIKVFATGGIGGVHRDGHNSMDISADLLELGKTSATVVSSGVKSILDIPRTLEYLETQGVCVACFQCPENDFPAFYTRSSGSKVPYNFETAAEAAKAIAISRMLNLKSGTLIAVPVPEEYAMDKSLIDAAISGALQAAQEQGVSGKEATPFLLSAISKITAGKSLTTNIALIKNNARVAAQIAVELANLNTGITSREVRETKTRNCDNIPVVVGASIVDTCYSVVEGELALNGATYHSKLQTSAGGVGRNLAEGIYKLNGAAHLITKVGNDQHGTFLRNIFPKAFQKTIFSDEIKLTASCAVVFDQSGDCKLMLADMEINNSITPEMIIKNEFLISKAPIVLFDGNISVDTMGTILDLCKKYQKPAFFEPTDMRIATKPFTLPTDLISQIKFISPNIFELIEISKTLNYSNSIPENVSLDELTTTYASDLKTMVAQVNDHVDNILLTLGPKGALVVRKESSQSLFFNKNGQYSDGCNTSLKSHVRFYPADPIENFINVSGAGDSFNVGFVTAMIRGMPEAICVSVGFQSAITALRSMAAVPDAYFSTEHSCWKREADCREF